MTKDNTGVMEKTMGKMSDRTKVIAVKVGGSDTKSVDVAVIKATNHNKVVPKEKHMTTLKNACKFGDKALIQHICSGLSKRAHVIGKWLIALKTCIAYHRLIRESGLLFITAAAAPSSSTVCALGLASFRDTSTKPAWDFSSFVRPYSAYLDAVVFAYSDLEYCPVEDPLGQKFKNLDVQTMLTQVPKMNALAKAASLCVPQKAALLSPIVQYAMVLILKDCLVLYASLSEIMLNIVDKFFDLEPAEAKQLLVVYKDTIQASSQLAKYMQDCKEAHISQGIDLPPDLQPVPEDFMKQMEEFSEGKGGDPPIYESPAKVDTPKAETPKAETPKAETPRPETPPAPRELPDLMCMDTPKGKSEPPSPFKEEDENDELAELWKSPSPVPANGHAPYGASQTGYIQTTSFLSGPTGMTAPLSDPFQNAPASNNPFLMPVPRTAPAPAAPAAPQPYNQGKGVTNVMGDLSLDTLGIRKPKEVVTTKTSPMRQTPASVALPAPVAAPKPASPSPTTSSHGPVAAKPAPPLIPSNPFYQAPPTGQPYGQALVTMPSQHDPFNPSHHDSEATHLPSGMLPPQAQHYTGGVTGYNQAVGYQHPQQYQQPQQHYQQAPQQWAPAPQAAGQWQGGFTPAYQSAAYGANPTGAPQHPQHNAFRSSVTGPAPANPFGGNTFGGPAPNAFGGNAF